MNETSDRDTHFAGFAELLIDELMSFQDTDDRPRARTVIARRAYDLAYHVLASDAVPECFSPEIALSDVPDMTTWPGEETIRVMSDNPFIPEYVLKELASIRPQRLLYGEWLQNECCECKSLEHVHLYRRKGTPGKITEYLCDSCYAKIAHYGAYEREWEPGDK